MQPHIFEKQYRNQTILTHKNTILLMITIILKLAIFAVQIATEIVQQFF
ncbi:hypothetical protein T190130A13A_10197 [Tenacibaculum sp. 190130A14a]|uniref:Uncharacterized protein n=1 Tax=Tenacibaculum polynesiense TaxID=3137857 RepID=A0ABM9P8Y9_9FLAO